MSSKLAVFSLARLRHTATLMHIASLKGQCHCSEVLGGLMINSTVIGMRCRSLMSGTKRSDAYVALMLASAAAYCKGERPVS